MNDLDGRFDPDFLTSPPAGEPGAPAPHHTATTPVRCYEIAALRPDGSIFVGQEMAPANRLYDSAFSAFDGRTQIVTLKGPVTIADLRPGDLVQTIDGTLRKLIWIGSSKFVPADTGHRLAQFRILPGAFGTHCPQVPVIAGPGARILVKEKGEMPNAGSGPSLVPLHQLADQDRIIEVTPPTPVRLFHLCLDRQDLIDVHGLPMASYHADSEFQKFLQPSLLTRFRTLFPQMGTVSDFSKSTQAVSCARPSCDPVRA